MYIISLDCRLLQSVTPSIIRRRFVHIMTWHDVINGIMSSDWSSSRCSLKSSCDAFSWPIVRDVTQFMALKESIIDSFVDEGLGTRWLTGLGCQRLGWLTLIKMSLFPLSKWLQKWLTFHTDAELSTRPHTTPSVPLPTRPYTQLSYNAFAVKLSFTALSVKLSGYTLV